MSLNKLKAAFFTAVGFMHTAPALAEIKYDEFGDAMKSEGGSIWSNIAQPAVIVIGLVLAGSNIFWPEKVKVHWVLSLIVGVGGGIYGPDIYNGLTGA